MKKNIDSTKQDSKEVEKQLFELINQAGDDARKRKQRAMSIHFDKIQKSIAEGIKNRQNPISI